MTSDQFLRRINPLVLLPILVVSSLMLSACQPFQSVYLQNYDSKDVVVTLALRDSVLLDQLTSVDERPRFRAGLPSPDDLLEDAEWTPIEITRTDNQTIRFTVPQRSTVRIARHLNLHRIQSITADTCDLSQLSRCFQMSTAYVSMSTRALVYHYDPRGQVDTAGE